MSDKKHISNKVNLKLISQGIENGETKSEIFDRLSAQYYDSDNIAKLTASFPDPELKTKYNGVNTLLFTLLIITAILKVIGVLPLILEKPAIGLIIILIIPILNIWFALEVKKTRGYIYRIIGMLAILGMLNSLRHIGETGIWILMDLIILAIISFLGFYIGKKMFPNYGFSGLKKDKSGKWIL